MPFRNDSTVIYKHPLDRSFQKPTRLGVKATWSKVKYIHSNGTSAIVNHKSQSNNQNSPQITSPHANGSSPPKTLNNGDCRNNGNLVKIGPNGEIFIASEHSIQVWDWLRSALEIRQLETKEQINGNSLEFTADDEDDTGNLYIVSSLNDIGIPSKEKIVDFYPIETNQDRNSYKVLLILQNVNNRETSFLIQKFGQIFPDDCDYNKYNKLLILPPIMHGGYPYVIKHSERFIGISTDEGCLTIFDERKKHPLSLSLNVDIANGNALFDIVGRFLVYTPKKLSEEYNSQTAKLSKLNVSEESHSIYKRILNSISTTAIDSLITLTEFEKIKSSSIRHYLSDLINTTYNLTTSYDSNPNSKSQIIILVDLETETTICQFKPPNGISNLSLCPYNSCHLITVSTRGDLIYKWDLTKLHKEVSLLDLQIRGKTSSIVSRISWSSIDSFQILTRKSGSVHSFNSNNNAENWILPNLGTKSISPFVTKSGGKYVMIIIEDTLSLVEKRSGNLVYQFTLPKLLIPKSLLPDYIPLKPNEEIIVRETSSEASSAKSKLSQIEIDSFVKTPSLVWENRHTKRFELKTYDYKNKRNGEDPQVSFWNNYRRSNPSSEFIVRSLCKGTEEVADETSCMDGIEVVKNLDITGDLASALDSVIISHDQII